MLTGILRAENLMGGGGGGKPLYKIRSTSITDKGIIFIMPKELL